MLGRIAAGVVWNAVIATTLCAQVGPEVLKQLPDSALAVILVNRLGATSKKIESIGQRLHLPVPGLLPIAKLRLGLNEGVDDEGSAAMAFLPRNDGDAGAADFLIAIPVTDYAKFLGQLAPENADASPTAVMIAGQPAHVARKGSFALLAKDNAVLKSALEAKRSVADVAGALAAWQTENDIVAISTPAGIGYSLDAIQNGLAGAQAGVANLDAATRSVVEMYYDLFEAVSGQARSDLQLLAVGLRVTGDTDLISSMRAIFTPDSGWDKSAKQATGVDTDLFLGLPPGPFVLALGMGKVGDWVGRLTDLSAEMIRSSTEQSGKPMTEAQVKQLRELYRPMVQQVRGMSMSVALPRPDAGVFSGTVGVVHVDSAKEYLAVVERYSADYQKLAEEINSPMLPPYSLKKTKIAGNDGLEVAVDLSAFAQKQPNPEVFKHFDKLFGPGGKMTAYYSVALDDHTVLFGYDRATIEQLVAHPPKPSLTDDQLVGESMQLLPSGSQFMSLFDLGNSMRLAAQVVQLMKDDPTFTLPEFPAAPPIGVAARLSADGFELRKAVPNKTLDAFGKFIDAARQQQLNR
ncbi:MAG TPA: hypothetical protein VG713_06975 [Pirellulales bacterium]|nr:hypothetical protein [Pirellulales bacterium]